MRARQTYSCVQLHLLFKRWENLLWFVIDFSDFSIVCFLVSIDRILMHCWASASINQIHVSTHSRIVYPINEGMSCLVLCSTVLVKSRSVGKFVVFADRSSSLYEHVRPTLVFNCTWFSSDGQICCGLWWIFWFQHCLFSGLNLSYFNALLS